MRLLGNLLWFLLGGWLSALGWAAAGVLWCITIIGIPVGLQCFKFASLSLFPFGKEVLYGGGAPSLLLNILDLIFSFPMPIILALMLNEIRVKWFKRTTQEKLENLNITIIGIPFGLQYFKIARLALFPFGSRIVEVL